MELNETMKINLEHDKADEVREIMNDVYSALTVKGYQRLAVPEPPTTTVADSLTGKVGVVTIATEVGNMKGKVRIGSDIWSATSDEPLEEGCKVVVEYSEGVHVHVRRV